MKPLPEGRERAIGWILAGLTVLHLLALHPRFSVGLGVFFVLLTGAALRGGRIHVPRWLGNTLLLLSVVAVGLAQDRIDVVSALSAFPGEMAVTAAAILLLRPLTPVLSQRVLLCLLVVLTAAILRSGVGQTLVALDVTAMYLILEESFRPPDAVISFWVSLSRSLRLIVPVGVVILVIFWLFPSLRAFSEPDLAVSGFSGGDVLDASLVAEVSQSRRVAFTARFARDQWIPSPDSLYWRGQVMENDQGFHWSAGRGVPHGVLLPRAAPGSSPQIVRYSQEITGNPGLIPALDHAVSMGAGGNGQDIVVIDNGAGTLSQGGTGPLALEVASSLEALTDAPDAAVQDGCLQVPGAVRESAFIRETAARIFAGGTGTSGRLRALARYFHDSGFRYTTRPGRIQDMAEFLAGKHVGFCSHYAMAAASLLRVAGVPARVVTGYRGGEWNPWLRTVTVRDSDAHAWVEAWDGAGRRWLRFDPTDFVAPELRAGIRREMDSGKWTWYHRDWSYGSFLVTATVASVRSVWHRLTALKLQYIVPAALFILLTGIALIRFIKNASARRAADPRKNTASLLLQLERQAARLQRGRKSCETPLAWLDRLTRTAGSVEEKTTLRDIASSYETGMYEPGGGGLPGTFRQDMRRLVRLWKREPARSS